MTRLQYEHSCGWLDGFGMKCCYPPPGLCVSPTHPFCIAASSSNIPDKGPKNRPSNPTDGHIHEGIFFNRYINKYSCFLKIKGRKDKFLIGHYEDYSQALLAYHEFIGEEP